MSRPQWVLDAESAGARAAAECGMKWPVKGMSSYREDNMLSASVSHHFSAGHRVMGLVGTGAKCANIHGHTFKVEWTVQIDESPDSPVDLAIVTTLLRGWVNGHLDHCFIVNTEDSPLINALADWNSKYYAMQGIDPTLQAIATLIAEQSQIILGDVRVLEVRVSNSPDSATTWTYDWQGYSAVESSEVREAGRISKLGAEVGQQVASKSSKHPVELTDESLVARAEPNIDLISRSFRRPVISATDQLNVDDDLNRMWEDRGTGAINGGAPQVVTLSGREYELYLNGALNETPPRERK